MTTTATETDAPARGKGGRPALGAAALVRRSAPRLTQSDWDYLALWHPGGEGDQIRALLERARAAWPEGPDRFGHKPGKKPRQRLPMGFVRDYAAQHGLRVEDAPAAALREFMALRKGAEK